MYSTSFAITPPCPRNSTRRGGQQDNSHGIHTGSSLLASRHSVRVIDLQYQHHSARDTSQLWGQEATLDAPSGGSPVHLQLVVQDAVSRGAPRVRRRRRPLGSCCPPPPPTHCSASQDPWRCDCRGASRRCRDFCRRSFERSVGWGVRWWRIVLAAATILVKLLLHVVKK